MSAVEALNAVLTAEHANQRLLAYGQVLELVPISEAVIWDDLCGKAFPLNSFFHHLTKDAAMRPEHTPQNCTWFRPVVEGSA